MPHLQQTSSAVRFSARRRLLDSDRLGLWYLSRRSAYRGLTITPRTELVMDGFPRSANSYAKFAFELAQGTSVALAGHTHSSALLKEGVRRGLPVVVLLREPRAAVASLLQLAPGVSASAGFKAYERFHSGVLPVADDVLIAPFEAVIADFGRVLARVNERFDVHFRPYEKTPDNEVAVMSLLEDSNRARNRGQLRTNSVARPSTSRRLAEEVLSSPSTRTARYMAQAQKVYEILLARHGA